MAATASRRVAGVMLLTALALAEVEMGADAKLPSVGKRQSYNDYCNYEVKNSSFLNPNGGNTLIIDFNKCEGAVNIRWYTPNIPQAYFDNNFANVDPTFPIIVRRRSSYFKVRVSGTRVCDNQPLRTAYVDELTWSENNPAREPRRKVLPFYSQSTWTPTSDGTYRVSLRMHTPRLSEALVNFKLSFYRRPLPAKRSTVI